MLFHYAEIYNTRLFHIPIDHLNGMDLYAEINDDHAHGQMEAPYLPCLRSNQISRQTVSLLLKQ